MAWGWSCAGSGAVVEVGGQALAWRESLAKSQTASRVVCHRTSESHRAHLPDWRVDGARGEAHQCFGVGNRARQSPISAKACGTEVQTGRLVKMWVGVGGSCFDLLDRMVIARESVRVVTRARVMGVWAAPRRVAPRGAAVNRVCRVAGGAAGIAHRFQPGTRRVGVSQWRGLAIKSSQELQTDRRSKSANSRARETRD